ncbi:SbcC family exonuclease [Lacticaseibacillus mingshuiensis]|uniref:SbcC family exonuclease n=1 Tax=Lacticaseibacillus mingshuiensis TaxID=2799574 RepID=A0ABW4CJZ0_9LACO|nr:SbcC family exonuclease [Lacticaseibacillus mingshuiensis]
MTIQSSLTYQKQFFNDFSDAWDKRSTYRLYKGIDTTAENLRLELAETPGYILAYDKTGENELHDFLQADLIKFLRGHIPFFEVADNGQVFFGDWFHRREFGRLNVFTRSIDQVTESQRTILPQLEAFSEDPDHYLDLQLEAMRKHVYAEVNTLSNQLESLEAEAPAQPTRQNPTSSFRGLIKNFIDPDDDDKPAPTPRRASAPDQSKLRSRFDAAKAEADSEFDAKKRQIQVAAAITRYEYQAVMNTYSSVAQFENILTSLRDDFMRALELKEEQANA